MSFNAKRIILVVPGLFFLLCVVVHYFHLGWFGDHSKKIMHFSFLFLLALLVALNVSAGEFNAFKKRRQGPRKKFNVCRARRSALELIHACMPRHRASRDATSGKGGKPSAIRLVCTTPPGCGHRSWRRTSRGLQRRLVARVRHWR
jgi:hypothetical protein